MTYALTAAMDPALIDNFDMDLGNTSETAMALILSLMMFSVALGLRTEHFSFFKTNPKVYLAGVFGQLLGLPILTVLLCYLLHPLPSVAFGMILIACCPGGNSSNLLALFGRADTALSVSLTATSSILAAFLTPISILFWSALYPPTRSLLTEIDLDVLSFLVQTLLILAIPLMLGMFIGRLAPIASLKWQRPLAMLSGLGLIAIIIGALMKFAPVLLTLGLSLIGIVIIHNSLAFLLGFGMGVLTKGNTAQKRALTFEVGIQNSGLGIVILLTQLGGLGGAGAVAGLWGTWHIIGGLMLVGLFKVQDRKQQGRSA